MNGNGGPLHRVLGDDILFFLREMQKLSTPLPTSPLGLPHCAGADTVGASSHRRNDKASTPPSVTTGSVSQDQHVVKVHKN